MGKSSMPAMPSAFIIMGVASSGKTTLGLLLAKHTGYDFKDADSFHPAENIAKMSRGEPLDDLDRWPWLDAIAEWLGAHRRQQTGCIVTCSALKKIYRARLVKGRSDLGLIFLEGDKELLQARIAARTGHFMPATLIDSQFATLESPERDENPLVLDVRLTPDAMVETVLRHYGHII